MSADSTSRTLITLALLAVLAGCIWLVRDVLPPFLIALALTLLLDPVLDRMERWGLPRWAAVTLTFGGFLAVFFGVVAFLVPRAAAQIGDLIHNWSTYDARLGEVVDGWTHENAELLRQFNLPPTAAEFWQRYQGEIGAYLQGLLQHAFVTLQASAALLGWIVVVPIVTLYLMMDIDRLRARLCYLVPDAQRETVVTLCSRVGGVFAAYLRGLVMVSASYGLLLYLVLALGFRLEYALILGLAGGFLYVVPYLGQLVVLATTCIVAWTTGHSGGYVLGVGAAVVAVGQLFDQLVTPRVIGQQVGLHPVIGLFALMVGGQLFGLSGMVIAVPVAAAARVVLIHLFPRLAEPIPPSASTSGVEAEEPGAVSYTMRGVTPITTAPVQEQEE
ncbi:MAG: AI-2E family transporter [Armatimonadota bacterium]